MIKAELATAQAGKWYFSLEILKTGKGGKRPFIAFGIQVSFTHHLSPFILVLLGLAFNLEKRTIEFIPFTPEKRKVHTIHVTEIEEERC